MSIFVKIVQVPGPVTEVALEDGATVTDALAAGDITPDSNQSVQVNGASVDSSATLHDSDRVIISRAAKSAA